MSVRCQCLAGSRKQKLGKLLQQKKKRKKREKKGDMRGGVCG